MIRPRTLAAAPLITVGTVGALLIGAALVVEAQREDEMWELEQEQLIAEMHAADLIVEYDDEYAPVLTVQDMPEHYSGTFIWDGEDEAYRQTLALDVEETSEVDGLIIATGRGTYTTSYRDVDISFRIEVDPDTGDWTMWESNPSVAANFVVDGRHTTNVQQDMDSISARWVGDDGMRGTLKLNAVPASARPGAARVHNVASRSYAEPVSANAMALDYGVRMELRHVGTRSNCVNSNHDRVRVHYTGWNDAGVFDDSWKRGVPATFQPSQVIKGWTTALHNMCAGDFARVWIPSEAAYGDNPRVGAPAGDLVFDIEVLGVN